MKKLLFILIAFFGTYAMAYATDPIDKEKIETEESIVTDTEKTEIPTLNADNAVNRVCPTCNDDYGKSYCVLRNTYNTEYCVGTKCRTRTLYRCSCESSHEYWIYKD
jgi:hypothetical protein